MRVLGEVLATRECGDCGFSAQALFLATLIDDFEWMVPDPFNPTSILFEDFETMFMDNPFDAPMLTEDFENFYLENPFDPPLFTEDFENGGW